MTNVQSLAVEAIGGIEYLYFKFILIETMT